MPPVNLNSNRVLVRGILWLWNQTNQAFVLDSILCPPTADAFKCILPS